MSIVIKNLIGGNKVEEEMNLYEDTKKLGEYDDAFSGDEKLQHKLVSIKSTVTLTEKIIDINDIVTSEFKKVSRCMTVTGMSSLIADWGVVSPIHVMRLEDDNCYLLLDGLRRVFAALRKGETKIRAVVWEFSDIDEGKDMAEIISLMINRTQRYSNKECWNIMQKLQDKSASPGLIEFLLQLKPGDAMKLQDIMTADIVDFWEYRESFLDDTLSIEMVYKKLTNIRKKENLLAKDDRTIITSNEEDEKDTGDDINTHRLLDVDEVKDLLELSNTDGVDEESIESLDRTSEVTKTVVQDKNDRKPIDPEIKMRVFRRDKFTCQCCDLSGEANSPVLVFHHIVGVACGGPDSVENGLTLCQNCHMLLHLYVFGKVRIEWDKFDDDETKKFKRICKYGNIQIDAWKKVGVSKEDAYKKDASSRRHLYPGEGLDVIRKAYASAEFDNEEDETS